MAPITNRRMLSCKSGISSENDTIARGRCPGWGSGLFLFDRKIADNLRSGQFFLFDNSQHFSHKRRRFSIKTKISKIIFLKAKLGLSFTCYDRFQRAMEGGGHMSAGERRQRILEILCLRRQDTYGNLATEFGVSRETIRRDILVLMCSYPIETVRGRHGGGVKISDDYWPYRKTLDSEQIDFLIRQSKKVEGRDLAILSSILFQLAPSQHIC